MKTIAVDIDDVLASSAQNLVDYSNEKRGTRLTVHDYVEDWSKMWQIDYNQTEERARAYHTPGVFNTIPHMEDADRVLRALADSYKLVIITSRRLEVQADTEAWLEDRFNGIFSDVHFAGFWDKITDKSDSLTKAELCKALGADYLIDDQLKHILAAADAGVQALLFGFYPWNKCRDGDLPENAVRVKNWLQVKEYFDAE